MSVHLDHTIVFARDRRNSAALIAAILDVPWAAESGVGAFSAIYVDDGLTLDVDELDTDIPIQHFCFRVDDAAFDAIVAGRAGRAQTHPTPPPRPR